MVCLDLLNLLREYENLATKEDRFIRHSLEQIADLHRKCDKSEYYYADAITRNFCRVIELLEQKQETSGQPRAEQLPFCNGDELIGAFYNHFKSPEQVDYWDIDRALYNGQQALVSPTLKDYAARIRTFCSPKYLGEMFTASQLQDRDPVLFTFENLELILATFRTRDALGNIVKQRVNIRSALRKLNEFKQSHKHQ